MWARGTRQSNRGALGAPATPQQVVTSKGRLDRVSVKERILNGSQSGGTGRIYPGGSVKDNHAIMPHDVTLMKRYKKIQRRLRNHPNDQYLASFNGEDYSKYPSHEHVNRAFFFTGIALGKDAYDSSVSDSGIATLIGGVYTINVSGPFAFSSGDEVMWTAPRLPKTGQTGVMYNTWNMGDPVGKRTPLIIPYRAVDNHTVLASTYATIKRSVKSSSHPGIKGASMSQYYNTTEGPNRKMRFNTSSQDEAFGIQYGLVSQSMFFLFGLLVEGLFPGKEEKMSASEAGQFIRRISETLGVFKKNRNEKQSSNLMNVLDYMYGPHANEVSDNRWPSVKETYKNAFITGFDSKGSPKETLNTMDSYLYRMVFDSMSMLWDTPAIGVEERRSNKIGVAGNNAEPGQGLTVIFGSGN